MSTDLRPRSLERDVSLDRLLLNGKKIDVNVVSAVIGGEIERTMDGASTVTFDLHDPQLALLRSGIFNERVVLVVDRLRYMLAGVSKSGDGLKLTFEDLEVALLRRHNKPRKATRGKVTRAQFALSLVREVKPKIKFYSPEMNKRQPIERSADRPTKGEKDTNREPGFSSDASFTVKGGKANRNQINNAERALDVARSKGAPRLAQLALVMAMIQESSITNLTHGHSSSVGILQLLDSWLGGSTSTDGGRRDIELVVAMFLDRGFTGRGGAIAIAKSNPNMDPAEVATRVQGNAAGAGDYSPHRSEAERIVDLYNGGEGTLPASATNSGATGKYEFSRGQPGQREDTWTALKRLAEEVRWRCFVVAGTIYFVSDEYLMRSRPLMRVSQDTIGVNYVDFDLDSGKKVQTCTVTCRIDRWAAPPGSVITVFNMGPADGRWLVQSVRRSIFDAEGTIELRRAQRPLPEPAAPEVGTSTIAGAGHGETASTGPTKLGASKPVAASYSPPGPHGAARNAFGDAEAADIMVPQGTSALAVADGTIESVRDTGNRDPGGNPNGIHVYLKTASNRFFYTHLFSVRVRAGQQVAAGDVIGTTGTANNVSHLHFEVENGSIKDWV